MCQPQYGWIFYKENVKNIPSNKIRNLFKIGLVIPEHLKPLQVSFYVLIDVKGLSSVRDGKSRQELIAEMEALCEVARRICLLTESGDHDVSLTKIDKE